MDASLMYALRIEYKEGVFYHGNHGVRCDIYNRFNGEHLSYGWGQDRKEALYFAEDTLRRNFDMLHELSLLGSM